MLLFITVIPVVLVVSHLLMFPKSKGSLKPIKVPVDRRKF